jgi:hypothetical protein
MNLKKTKEILSEKLRVNSETLEYVLNSPVQASPKISAYLKETIEKLASVIEECEICDESDLSSCFYVTAKAFGELNFCEKVEQENLKDMAVFSIKHHTSYLVTTYRDLSDEHQTEVSESIINAVFEGIFFNKTMLKKCTMLKWDDFEQIGNILADYRSATLTLEGLIVKYYNNLH